jgi:Na+/proline symporter
VVDLKILRRAIMVGVIFELMLVAMGHYRPAFRPTFELFGCMLIAGVAGLLYARDLARGYGAGILGGAAVGAVCGLVAVASASLLGDKPDQYSPYGVIVSTITGVAGGFFGQLDAQLRAIIKSLQSGK